jgi:predicted dehydrogenase
MSSAGQSSASNTLRIAVAGAGVIGRRHTELIQANSHTTLSALVDPAPASVALAAELGVPHFASLEALLQQDRPDGVILATPNPLHVPGAMLCLQHGVPALIEKPVADTLQSGQLLADALAAKALPMLVGHHRRHGAILQRAREVIASGQLGRIVTVMGSAQFCKPDSYFEQGPWRKQPGGGPILINLIHELDNLRYLCGEIDSVHAVASNAVRGFAVEDTAVMSLRFASGALGTFTLSDVAAAPFSWEQTSGENKAYARYPQENCYVVAGTRGSLAVPSLRSWRHAPAPVGEPGWMTPFVEQTLAVDDVDPLAAQLLHFCDVIEGRAAPIITVNDALQSLRAVEAVRRSIATGATIALKDLN